MAARVIKRNQEQESFRPIFLLFFFCMMYPMISWAQPVPSASQPSLIKFTPVDPREDKPLYKKDRIIVKFKDSAAQAGNSSDKLLSKYKARKVQSVFDDREKDWAARRQKIQKLKQEHVQRIEDVKKKYSHRVSDKGTNTPDLYNVYSVEIEPGADIEKAVAEFAKDPNVAYAQPDYIMEAFLTPTDPYYHSTGSWGQTEGDLWGLPKMKAEESWDITQGEGVVVAVIDTGLDYNHPDIVENIWINPGEDLNHNGTFDELDVNGVDDDANGIVDDIRGAHFSSTCVRTDGDPIFPECLEWSYQRTNDPMDGHGHGTHVSGTIAAVANTEGVIGVAPKAKIMALKGLSDEGYGNTVDLADAIVYAATNGADVINNSWGCAGCPRMPAIEDAVRAAYDLGVTVVFAAGNSYKDVTYSTPQSMTDPKPVVVAAATPQGIPTYFSNYGELVDFAAPGGGAVDSPPGIRSERNILSLKSAVCHAQMCPPELIVGTNYVRQAGTSMAAPHASGAAALLRAQHPDWTPDQVRRILKATADDDHLRAGFDIYMGGGNLNVYKALQADSVLNVQITGPVLNTNFTDGTPSVIITGTAEGPNFKEYQLSYRDVNVNEWISILPQPANVPVTNNVLGTWNLTTLPEGAYILRLVATTQGNVSYTDQIKVSKQNSNTLVATTNPYSDSVPSVYGNRISWGDTRSDGFTRDVYVYDINGGREDRLTMDSQFQDYPFITDRSVVWQDSEVPFVDGGITAYDLDRRTSQVISNFGSFPVASGDKVAWQSAEGNVFLFDGADNQVHQLTYEVPLHFNVPMKSWGWIPDWISNVSISGDRLAWVQWSNVRDPSIIWFGEPHNGNPNHSQIYIFDYQVFEGREITNRPTLKLNPSIWGDKVVWMEYRYGNWDIFMFDLTTNTESQVTANSQNQAYPSIWSDRIVWQDDRNMNADIYMYDLKTSNEKQLTFDSSSQTTPSISGNHITWVESNGQIERKIYLDEIFPAMLTLISPVGGEVLPVGSQQAITWFADPAISTVTLEYSIDGGQSYPFVIASSVPADTGSYQWTVPQIAGTQVRIKVSNTSNAEVNDVSDRDFQVKVTGRLTLTSPDGGESWPVGSLQDITWDTDGTVSSIKIEYSANGLTYFHVIAENVDASLKRYTWKIPNMVSVNGRVRITSNQEPALSDASNFSFLIPEIPPTPIIIDPQSQIRPVLSGNHLVWADGRDQKCHYYNLDRPDLNDQALPGQCAPNTSFDFSYPILVKRAIFPAYTFSYYDFEHPELGEQVIPATTARGRISISGTRIVWDDLDNVMLYDVAHPEIGVQSITSAAGVQKHPVIRGTKIVWGDFRDPQQPYIYLYDLDQPQLGEQRVVPLQVSEQFIHSFSFSLDEDFIVWYDNTNHVHYVDLNDPERGTQQITTGLGKNISPKISRNFIVWTSDRNGNNDIYLYDLTHPERGEQQITTESSSQAGPSVFGNNIIWQDSRNGNFDIFMHKVPDTTPPGTVISGIDSLWHNTPVTVTLSATDTESGVDNTYYSTDGSNPSVVYTGPVTLSNDGIHTIKYYSTDKAGNTEAVQTAPSPVKIDRTVPSATVSINNGAASTNNPGVTLNIAATDSGSGMDKMQFSNNGTTWSTPEAYAATKSWTLALGSGTKTVYAKFQDVAGNWTQAVSDTIDYTEIVHKIDPARVTVSSGKVAKMTFSVPFDAISSKLYMYCPAGLTIGLGANNNICNSWQTLSLPASSQTEMQFKVTNATTAVLKAVPNFYIYKASNPNYGYGVSGEITVEADTVPPVISSSAPIATLPYGTTQTTMTVNTNENATCKYDFSPNKTYSTMLYAFTTTGGSTHSQSITGLVNGGLKTIYVMCKDAAGNVNTPDYLQLYAVRLSTTDLTAPSPVPSNLTAMALSSTQVKLQWGGSTDPSGMVYYRIYRRVNALNSSFAFVGTATTTAYTDSYGLIKGTKYIYKVLAYDNARNFTAFSNESSVTIP